MGNTVSGAQGVISDATERITIISMLYESAINFILHAKKSMQSGDRDGRRRYIARASGIVNELSGALDMNSGSMSQNLYDLYSFVLSSLEKAEGETSIDDLENAEKVLEILRDAWHEVQTASECCHNE